MGEGRLDDLPHAGGKMFRSITWWRSDLGKDVRTFGNIVNLNVVNFSVYL